MTDAVRTPDELLQGLPDFPFDSSYREHEGLRRMVLACLLFALTLLLLLASPRRRRFKH